MLLRISVSCCLTTFQEFLSRKFNFPSTSFILWNFFWFLYAKSLMKLWFKALLRAEFSCWIHLESGESQEVFNENKYEGQLGKILGIEPSWRYVFWNFTAIMIPVGFLFFCQRLTILPLCPPVENVAHIPRKILKTKPLLNSCENLRKSVSKNLQYEAFFLQFLEI